MKKSIISWITVVVMLISFVTVPAFAEVTTENVISQAMLLGQSVGGQKTNYGHRILQNENFVFMVDGIPVNGFSNTDVKHTDCIRIFEKPNENHFDYKYLGDIKRTSGSKNYGAPVRSVEIYNDVLYVSWGNAIYKADAHGYAPQGDQVSYHQAIDVSKEAIEDFVASGVALPTATVKSYAEQRITTYAPYIRGGILYVDKESDKVYASGVATGRREYYDISTNDIEGAFSGGSVKRTRVDFMGKSFNTVKFIVKDGYIFELLQPKAGLYDFTIGTNTLVDSDGNTENNTVYIYDIEKGVSEIGVTNTNEAHMTSYKRGQYQTAVTGNHGINDIDVSGDYLYVATNEGLEIVDVSPAKGNENAGDLEAEAKITDIGKVNGISIFEEKLYAGTNEAMLVYDISENIPSLLYTLPYEGGFIDFDYNDEENMIYCLSAAKSGGMVIIDLDTLNEGLLLKDFDFMQNSKKVEEIKEGELSFVGEIENAGKEAVEIKTVLALYKGNKLADISIEEFTVDAEEKIDVEGTVVAGSGKDYNAVFVILDSDDRLLSMKTQNGIEYKKEIGTKAAETVISENGFDVTEPDELGNITVSGTVKALANKSVLIVAQDVNADEDDKLSGYRFIDVVTLDKNGKYSSYINPADSGTVAFKASRDIGTGTAVKEISIPELSVTAADSVEIPGIDSFVYLLLENGQNTEKLEIEITFDGEVITADENVTVSDEFVLENAIAESGKLTVELSKKSKAVLTTAETEFLTVPIKISDDAELKDYEIEVTVKATDNLSEELNSVAEGGIITVNQTTLKYEVLAKAKESLKALKKADEIQIDDYLTEKVKIEKAREDVNEAYEYLLRDSQIGVALLDNLAEAEKKLTEILPYYEAVDTLESADSENLLSTIENNKDKFSISDDAIEFYKNLEDKSATDKVILESDFEKPSDVMKAFYESVVLESLPDAGWQTVRPILALVEKTGKVDLSEYNELTDDEKAEAEKILAYTEYESLSALEDAVKAAVESAKEEKPSRPSGGSSSGSSGSSKGGKEYYVQPAEPTQAPVTENKEIFNDIAQFGWAKTAIKTLYNKGIINGKANGIFAPDENVTREEFAKMIAAAFDITADTNTKVFSDVASNAWYEKYIYALAENGIITGRDDGTFGVGNKITREEMAVILERAANLKGIDLSETEIQFADSDIISAYAKTAIGRMYATGIISGYPDGTVKPRDFANRAQAAQLIYNLMNLQ